MVSGCNFQKRGIIMGQQVTLHQTSSRELHLVSCGYEDCSMDQSYGPIVCHYYILHFVLHGQGHFYNNKTHYVINKNQYFLITPGTLVFYRAEACNPWTYTWICFNGTSVPDMLERCHINQESPVQTYSRPEDIADIISDMMKCHEKTPANECHIQSGLYAIFAKLCEASNASYNALESNDNFYVSQATAYILGNAGPDITVEYLANYLHISRSYLFTLFKRHLNTSPQRFLAMARIRNACELLGNTDLPIATISNACGYQNPFAFSRAFKKEIETTPTEYRRANSASKKQPNINQPKPSVQ